MPPPAGGIETHYVDALGKRHGSPKPALDAIRRAMGLDENAERRRTPPVLIVPERARARVGPADVILEDGSSLIVERTLPPGVPTGYHRIARRGGDPVPLIVTPARCFLPSAYRAWGWAIQLYAARSRRSWGMGDLSDLQRLGRWARRNGAGIALVNPLAASAPTVPQQASPYLPSSRRFRNPLYLRIEDVDGAREVPGVRDLARRARALNSERRIDRDAVFTLKMNALQKIWRVVRNREDRELDAFVAGQGEGLAEFATFCVLAERFGAGWQRWPDPFRHPHGAAVRRFRKEPKTAERIRFHQWLQFHVERQLAAASDALPVMQDLPIGFDPGGADAWALQDVLAHGISVGAPPDEFNTKGQNWGSPPFVPHKLRAAGYDPFIQTIRACLRYAGGLRIDHVMGLFRLFWIPAGMEARDGAYVRSAAADLLAIVALESQRARAVIVGEDLGTVEEEAREQLTERHVLSYRLVWFEQTSPARFPRQALAAVTTHDLPTIAGLWNGSDIEAQKTLGLSPNERGTRDIVARVRQMTGATARTSMEAIVARVHEALSAAPSRILTATLDDAMAVEERPNMPATTDEWPNWSIALPRPIEALEREGLPRRIARALSRRSSSHRRLL
jgi:4-alpha-glucanotransferase